MNAKVFVAVRIILGLFVLIFGLNKFLNFLPAPEGMSEAAGAYFGALMSAKVITLVAIVEILAGIALILNKYGALMALILMSVSVNIILFHVTLNPEGIAPGFAVFILNLMALYSYKNKYKDLLAG
ncbi:DoxX family membrane protein [Confluentibacter flavum]|uniref:DoxX family protein n=1 Tax=Confluentibacter flavum TaxID=1909700 RepID=A0A2N3HEW8_9FLAO|nr:DoxX family membrane protein [Confluentibacter flavum]PKQ43515.1 DoxX family protein [Confluentibacter flavum]